MNIGFIFCFIILLILIVNNYLRHIKEKFNYQPKIAFCFFGISYEDLNHWWGKKFRINYKKSIDNYKTHLYNYFENKGYKIDTFLCTNNVPDYIKKDLQTDFNSKNISYLSTQENKVLSKNNKIIKVIENAISNGNNYDLYLITRFDLIFNYNFNEINFDFNKLNIASILEQDNSICDNFYIIPKKYIIPFYNVLIENKEKMYHFIKDKLKDKNIKIHYFKNEKVPIPMLSFYDIVRNQIINKNTKLSHKDILENQNFIKSRFLNIS